MEFDSAYKAWVLGPQAENYTAFEKMLLDAFRDYSYWRRNFHPEDVSFITSKDRQDEEFQKYLETCNDRLFEMLSLLKRSVPFFSPRYLGHMNTDLLIPGVIGYIAAMLYNQNNIVEEASTVTLPLESEAMQLVAKMLRLSTDGEEDQSWGHLCSGGTAANIEALWVARNLRLVPHQIALTLKHSQEKNYKEYEDDLKNLPVESLGIIFGNVIKEKKLHALQIQDIIDLHAALADICCRKAGLAQVVRDHSAEYLGLAKFSELCRQNPLDQYPSSFKILLSQNAHYSLLKSIGVLGLGEECLVKIKLDESMRIDTEELKNEIQHQRKNNACILAVIAVYGSTEEGAIDDFPAICKLRNRHCGDFWIHGDACYGGYALSITHPSKKKELAHYAHQPMVDVLRYYMPKLYEHVRGKEPPSADKIVWSKDKSNDWIRRSEALGMCDSVSIDPHKLGYIPYPAGAVFYRDYRVRELIRCNAPYLNAAEAERESYDGTEEDKKKKIWKSPYLGEYTLEGSRPGATAAAIWLAHTTIPLDIGSHGQAILHSILGARYLKHVLQEKFTYRDTETDTYIKCCFLNDDPDLNILCYTFSGKIDGSPIPLSVLNRSVEALYNELLPTQHDLTRTPDFVIAKTKLSVSEYGGEFLRKSFLEKLRANGLSGDVKCSGEGNPWRDDDKIVLVRTVVMGQSLLQAKTQSEHEGEVQYLAEKYAEFLKDKLEKVLRKTLSDPIEKETRPQLKKTVFIFEDDPLTRETLYRQLSSKSFQGCGKILTPNDLTEALNMIKSEGIAAALVDIHRPDNQEAGYEFLKMAMKMRPSEFQGATIFTVLERSDVEEKLNNLNKELPYCSGRWNIKVHRKPTLDGKEFQTAMNRVMGDLWDILNPP